MHDAAFTVSLHVDLTMNKISKKVVQEISSIHSPRQHCNLWCNL